MARLWQQRRGRLIPWRSLLGCALLALVALLLGSPPGASAAPQSGAAGAPRIALDPRSGPCATRVAVYGGDFTPDVTAQFVLTRDRDGAITAHNSSGGGQRVASDGTFTMVIPIIGCDPGEPLGSTFTIAIFEFRPDGTPPRGPVASATFTITAPGTTPGLPNTGGGWAASQVMSPLGPALALGLIILGVALRHRRVAQAQQ
jgi:hypothetical protein